MVAALLYSNRYAGRPRLLLARWLEVAQQCQDVIIVQCLGAYNRFKLPTNSMMYDDTRREFVDSENLRRMPGRERKSDGPSDDPEEDDLREGVV